MEIFENDSQESGESPNSESSNSAATSIESVVTEVEEECVKKRRRHLAVHWNRPIAKVYDDNFGFSVNGYQPMIDYLDAKDLGNPVKRGEVHLPYLEERCLDRYSSHNPFKFYDNRDIDRYIAKGEKIRTQIRQNDAAGASNVLRRTHSNWSMTKKYVQLVKNSYVIDHRKQQPDSDFEYSSVPQAEFSLYDLMASHLRVDPAVASRMSNRRLDHESSIVSRRARLNELDKQFDQTLRNMKYTVEGISQPPSVTTGMYGEVLSQDAISAGDDMVLRNRYRREEDMNSLNAHVDRITSTDNIRRRLPADLDLRNSGATGYIRRKQANTLQSGLGAELQRIQGSRTTEKPYRTAINDLNDDFMLNYLVRRELTRPSIEDYRVPLEALTPRAHTISDVQERVISRAKEMTGDTSETRRIKERAKYLNILAPQPKTPVFNHEVAASRLQSNIDHMADGLASSGTAYRKYNIEDEMANVTSRPNDGAYQEYRIRQAAEPVHKIPSDYPRVRSAECRARERTAVLGL